MRDPASRARTIGAAFLTAAAIAAVLPSGALAYGGPGSFSTTTGTDGVVPPPVFYPGTTSVIDSWKLVGAFPASQTLVAPRWVMASGHAPAVKTWGYNSPLTPTAAVAVAKEVMIPDQPFAPQEDGRTPPNLTDGRADFSLTLLDVPMPAPSVGFPRLIREPVGADLTSTLPGAVLWTGYGNTGLKNQRSGWMKPNGLSMNGDDYVKVLNGDSGSTGAWFPNSSARPVFASITTDGGVSGLAWGRDSAFSSPLGPATNGSTESYATLGDWVRAKIAAEAAKDPTVGSPEWATFEQLGVNLSTLRPPAPRNVRVGTATPTSLSVVWAPSEERRVPVTGYRVTLQPGGVVRNLSATSRSTNFSGLQTGTEYSVTVKAVNANGESAVHTKTTIPSEPVIEPDTVKYRTRLTPGAPQLELTSYPSAAGNKSTYCVGIRATFDDATPPAPGESLAHEVFFDGDLLPIEDFKTDGAARTTAVCSGDQGFVVGPATRHSVLARTRSGVNAGPYVYKSIQSPTGVPVGTTLNPPRSATSITRRSVRDGKVDYCLDVTWSAPVPVVGYPHRSTALLLEEPLEDDPEEQYVEGLSPSTDRHTFCGLKAGGKYRVRVDADLTNAVTKAFAAVSSPVGAPLGTPLAPPASFATSTRKRADGDYCVKSTWTPPAAIAGFPVSGYTMVVMTFSGIYTETDVGPSASSAETCGLPAATNFIVVTGARYPLDGGQETWATALRGAKTPS